VKLLHLVGFITKKYLEWVSHWNLYWHCNKCVTVEVPKLRRSTAEDGKFGRGDGAWDRRVTATIPNQTSAYSWCHGPET